MAFDGITVAALRKELAEISDGSRISRITQPESDAVVLVVRTKEETKKLYLSASASLPLCYLTTKNYESPKTAPNFCMVLRKYIGNARIASVTQPGLERILDFSLEHLDEMGDLTVRHLILELMGKHSNLILCDDAGTIIDAIKRIPAQISSVREVLPGRPYFIPNPKGKRDPFSVSESDVISLLHAGNTGIAKTLCSSFTGISSCMAEEICFSSGIDVDLHAEDLSEDEILHLAHQFLLLTDQVRKEDFSPTIYYRADVPEEFSAIPLTNRLCNEKGNPEKSHKSFESASSMLETYYRDRNEAVRTREKSTELRKTVQTHLERCAKKEDLQEKQLENTKNRDKFRHYGDLLMTYGSSVEPGASSLTVPDYESGEEITISLDPTLSAVKNAQKYYARYDRLKRTKEALTVQLAETREELSHLSSIAASLNAPLENEDLEEIREELVRYGYLKKQNAPGKKGKKNTEKGKPHRYLSDDGFVIYVGKNNFQNEELSLRFADAKDLFVHAKNCPGSHVIIRTEGKEVPMRTIIEAAELAAWYSADRESSKVEVDYVEKKELRKPSGTRPGYVIYHTNSSILVNPKENHIKKLA